MHRNTRATSGLILTALSGAIACGTDDQRIVDTAALRATGASLDAPRGADTARHAGAMQGVTESELAKRSKRHMSTAIIDSIEKRLQSLEGISAAQMTTIVPAHGQLVTRLLSELEADMRARNMVPDDAWRALTDSVRRDLARMPKMEGSELRVFMPDHHRRVDHLLTTHRKLMGGPKT